METIEKISLATLAAATPMEVFIQSRDHLLEQNERSRDPSKCLYLNSKGLKCAAGCFISKEEYRREFEGKRWSDLACAPEKHVRLILTLQGIHDHNSPEIWADLLNGLEHRVLRGDFEE